MDSDAVTRHHALLVRGNRLTSQSAASIEKSRNALIRSHIRLGLSDRRLVHCTAITRSWQARIPARAAA
jgi:hypothetical protein